MIWALLLVGIICAACITSMEWENRRNRQRASRLYRYMMNRRVSFVSWNPRAHGTLTDVRWSTIAKIHATPFNPMDA